jgi:hypothetical protein
MNEENILTATAETIRRLDALLEHMEHDRHTATDTLAALRASINKTLYAGMINVPVAAQPFKIPIDFVVPFATLAFADTAGLTLSFDIGGIGATTGVGTVVANVNDWGCVPLPGRSLYVTAVTAGKFFLALFTTPQPFAWGKC